MWPGEPRLKVSRILIMFAYGLFLMLLTFFLWSMLENVDLGMGGFKILIPILIVMSLWIVGGSAIRGWFLDEDSEEDQDKTRRS